MENNKESSKLFPIYKLAATPDKYIPGKILGPKRTIAATAKPVGSQTNAALPSAILKKFNEITAKKKYTRAIRLGIFIRVNKIIPQSRLR